MRKIDFHIIGLNLISTAALSIFLIYTLIQIQVITKSPFQLEHPYTEVSIAVSESLSPATTKSMMQQLWTFIEEKKILTIVQNVDSLRLGLYDPEQVYAKYPLVSGKYFDAKIKPNDAILLAKQDSFVQQYSQENENTYTISNQTYSLVGVYNIEHPLSTESTDYIVPVYDLNDIRGTYFFDTQDQQDIETLKAIFKNENLYVDIRSSGFKKTFTFILNQLLHTTTYAVTCLGLLFIYANFYVFFVFHMLKFKKIIAIHHRFGGSSSQILLRSYWYIFLNIAIGSTLGSIVYILFLEWGKLSFSLLTLFMIILVNFICSSVLYLFSFYNRMSKHKRGDFI